MMIMTGKIMKKYLLFFFGFSLLSGCVKETCISDMYFEKEFIASFDKQSKTTINSSGKVDWSKDDIISYYSSSDGEVNSVYVPESSHSVNFLAKLGIDDSFIIAAYGGEISSNKGKSMTLNDAVKANQTGTFEDAHVSVCKRYLENGNILSFKNITSLIKFSLERTDVRYVSFTAEDGTKIHGDGKLYVSFDEENPLTTFGTDEGGNIIGITIDGAGSFYISTLPCSIAEFSLCFYDSEKKLLGAIYSEKTLVLGVNNIVNLGTLDSRIESPKVIDLSASGTANCYIASKLNYPYKYKATVKGNSEESIGVPKKVKVLWESFGTDETPSVNSVVSNVSLEQGYINFTAEHDGNAVIAALNSDDEILWSWHIWVCNGYYPEIKAQEYKNNAGVIMDRNLGATSVTAGDVQALGLLYQWGRKDPFLGGCQISYNVISDQQKASSTLLWPTPVQSNSNNGTIQYSILHPTTFIIKNSYNSDWFYSGDYSTDGTRWKSSTYKKSIYDPCPIGWRVPDGSHYGLWATAFGSSSDIKYGPWDNTNNGMNFGTGNGKDERMQLGSSSIIWYPASGSIDDNTGNLHECGDYGYYWSSFSAVGGASGFYFSSSGTICPPPLLRYSCALSVRCSKY